MALYYFNLKDPQGIIVDPEGTEFASDDEAREHAAQVAKELMQNRGPETRTWRLQVCDAARRPCCELLFATLADNHLPGDLRKTVISLSSNFASLYDTMSELQMALRQIDNTMARAQGMPYLAALNGTAVGGAATEQSLVTE